MNQSANSGVTVYGGTAPAIVTAVRVARSGLDVTLVTPTRSLGGSLPSLGAVETHYRGVRAPLLQEFVDRVVNHYRDRYGENSEPYPRRYEALRDAVGLAHLDVRNGRDAQVIVQDEDDSFRPQWDSSRDPEPPPLVPES